MSNRTKFNEKFKELWKLAELDFLLFTIEAVAAGKYTVKEIATIIGIEEMALRKRISRYKLENK